MKIEKFTTKNKLELTGFIFIYATLFINAIIMQDSPAAILSAFCGITYTILAGKGIPACYLIGATGSAFYVYLSFLSNLWGNLVLYAFYYIPMQIFGFFQWNKNLKDNKYEIIKIQLTQKQRIILLITAVIISAVTILILRHYGDKSPFMDGITTVFSILGLYLTVKRTIDQWLVWFIVNLLSLIMWIQVGLTGSKVYSTIFMWFVYTFLAVYFFITWKKELKSNYSE